MKVLWTHVGMGDSILQAGLAVALAKRYGSIAFPCYSQYLPSVSSFFVDHPEITVFPVEHQAGWAWGSPPDEEYDRAMAAAGISSPEVIRLAAYTGRGFGEDFSRSFYADAAVGYEERFDSCPIASAAESVPQLAWVDPLEDNAFLHDDPARGFTINRLEDREKFFRPVMAPGESILQYVNLLQTAALVACIDSALFHLANSLELQGEAQLHCYARWPRSRHFRYASKNNWQYLF